MPALGQPSCMEPSVLCWMRVSSETADTGASIADLRQMHCLDSIEVPPAMSLAAVSTKSDASLSLHPCKKYIIYDDGQKTGQYMTCAYAVSEQLCWLPCLQCSGVYGIPLALIAARLQCTRWKTPGKTHSRIMLQVHGYFSALICLQLVTVRQVEQCVMQSSKHLRLLADDQDIFLVVRTLSRLRTYLKELAAGTVEAPEPNPAPGHRKLLRQIRERTHWLAWAIAGEDERQVKCSC